jgi:bisphosphoglycerate-independent phosphoglycerate mutase (AlkP superfamily)
MVFLDGDSLIFIDFRADRMRQIVEAFGIKPQFETDKIPKDIVSDNWEFVPKPTWNGGNECLCMRPFKN